MTLSAFSRDVEQAMGTLDWEKPWKNFWLLRYFWQSVGTSTKLANILAVVVDTTPEETHEEEAAEGDAETTE